MTPTPISESHRRPDLVAVGALVLVALALPVWLASAAGAIGMPTNDDWVYTRAAAHLFDTGTVEMTGHTTAFIGQLAMVQPFLWLSGGEVWGFTAFEMITLAVAVVSTYFLARCYVGMGAAVVTVVLVLAFPGFARVSLSFMTDIPAYAFAMLCLLLGTRFLQGRGGGPTLIAAVVVGVIGVSIREFVLAAPLAVLLAGWIRNRAGDRAVLLVASVVLVASVAGVLSVSRSSSGSGTPSSVGFGGLLDLGPAFATLAAVVLAGTILYAGRGSLRLRPVHIAFGTAVGLLVVVTPGGPLVGNLWGASGFGGSQLLAGVRGPVFGTLAWGLSELVIVFATILAAGLVARLVERELARVSSIPAAWNTAIGVARSEDGLLVLFLLGYAGELVLFALIGGLFDRFLYPIVPVTAILLLRRSVRLNALDLSHAIALGALIWLGASAIVLAANSFAYDAARYREGEAAVAMGYDPQTIDAGYEWVGSHGSGIKTGTDPKRINWWDDIWASYRPCAVLSNSSVEIPGYRLVRVNPEAYRQMLFFGPAQPLYLYGALAMAGCPTPAPVAGAK